MINSVIVRLFLLCLGAVLFVVNATAPFLYTKRKRDDPVASFSSYSFAVLSFLTLCFFYYMHQHHSDNCRKGNARNQQAAPERPRGSGQTNPDAENRIRIGKSAHSGPSPVLSPRIQEILLGQGFRKNIHKSA